jgi:hypothetical protein
MNDISLILVKNERAVSDKPSWMPNELIPLPHRILFQNEFVGLLLAGLKRGQELLLQPTSSLLLTVTHGQVQLIKRNRFFTLRESGQHRLETDEDWEIHAVSEADLLFFIPTARAVY